MTRLAFGAVGANNLTIDGLTSAGSVTIVSSPFTGGGPYAVAADATVGGAAASYTIALTGGRGYYVRGRFRISATPTADCMLLACGNLGPASAAAFGLGFQSGSLAIRLFGGGSVRDVAGPTVIANTDFLLELYIIINAAGDDTITGRLNGTQFATFTGALTATVPSNFLWGGTGATGVTVHATDWAVNDDQGANNNSWCGDARTALLLPVSDDAVKSAIGADAWRAGNSSSTDLWAAVDNTPPVGATSPGTTTSQIVCDTPSTNRTYVPLTATYDSQCGVGATINLVQVVCANAESVSTGTKTGGIGLDSNPSLANTSFTYGADAGAGAAYPTTWQISRSATVVSPSVTPSSGASPRVQMATSTRNGDVCFMGVYVDYTVAAGPAQDNPERYGRPHGLRGANQMQQALAF